MRWGHSMTWRSIINKFFLFCALAWIIASEIASASEHHGQVVFNGLAVPGATVTATQGDKKVAAITNRQGTYSFSDLQDGSWTIEVGMTGFSTVKQDATVAPNAPPATWELNLLPLDQIRAQAKPAEPPPVPVAPAERTASEQPKPQDNKNLSTAAAKTEAPKENQNQDAADGFLINGSMNNGAASPFAQAMAFGNNRKGAKGLYTGGIGLTFDNSVLDAKQFSLTGLNTPKPEYNDLTGMVTLGGPLKIPHLLPNGPNFFLAYQWTRNHNAVTQSVRVPDIAERNGDFSQVLNASGQPIQIFDPKTGLPFSGNVIPQNRISSQAQALLNFYPHPNFDGGTRYNYQIPVVTNTHQDALQSRLNKTLNNRNQLYGGFAFQSSRSSSPNVFSFVDTTDILGINTSINWSHRFGQHLFMNLGYQFSRLRTKVTPYFANRENVSGNAGITGNNQDPTNWGPPALTFSSGIAGLSDGQSAFNRNQTNAWSYSMFWNHNRHNITLGGDLRRQEFNYFSQQDPRGLFTFTGAATQGGVSGSGSDIADLLLGAPDTSSIAFGNPDKYLRQSVYDAFITDDWRLRPELTLNAGVRWEYGAPITELHGRLVNLDVASGFSAVAPIVANSPVGSLTGRKYPDSLIQPDKSGIEPRIGIAWRPVSGASLVVRAGYGIYYDTSVYQTVAVQMDQQAPLSKSLSVENSATCPLTLANGFHSCSSTTLNTFAADSNFRVGYAQNWQLSVQRDLPGSFQMTATYLGVKGTHGVQEFLPNTYPIGSVNPCPSCPIGFAYLISGGNSTRESGQLQLRRRLHNGLAGMLQYTYSKSIDDDSAVGGQGASAGSQNGLLPNSGNNPGTGISGGSSQSSSQNSPTIAQNWLNLAGERGLSNFDQRHLLNLQLQYSTGMGMGGGTLMSGWKGTLLKEWTFFTQISAASGLPQTPLYPAAVPGTGVTGSIRPNYTGASIYAGSHGYFLNREAYTAPLSGQWGSAGRNSITGPSQFSLNAALARTFRLTDRYNLDFRVNSTNLLNHVTYTSWNTTTTSPQFGLPLAANSMRSMQTTLRLRF